MPQLDFETFFVQLVWYLMIFTVNLIIIYSKLMPAFCRINLVRWKLYKRFSSYIDALNIEAATYFSMNLKFLSEITGSFIENFFKQVKAEEEQYLSKFSVLQNHNQEELDKIERITSLSLIGFLFVESEDMVNYFFFSVFFLVFILFIYWSFILKEFILEIFYINYFHNYFVKISNMVNTINLILNKFLNNVYLKDTVIFKFWETEQDLKLNFLLVSYNLILLNYMQTQEIALTDEIFKEDDGVDVVKGFDDIEHFDLEDMKLLLVLN
jgi:hypothetical protein